MRSAFYAGYDDSDREYIVLGDAGRRIAKGTPLMSTTFGSLCWFAREYCRRVLSTRRWSSPVGDGG